jgi:hypothetical protein
LQQGQQQVLRLYRRIICAHGQALRVAQRLLKFGGEFIESHLAAP